MLLHLLHLILACTGAAHAGQDTFATASDQLVKAPGAMPAGEGSPPATPYPTHPHPLGYVAYRAERTPTINGRLDDSCWQAAPWSEPFMDIEGPSKPKPWHQTRVKMLWDDEALYIAAWLDEPQPWATLELHDAVIFRDNDFEVFLDPDGDNHNYMEIEINALGTVWDLFLTKPYRDGAVVMHSWETLSPSEPTQLDGPTGWKPMRRAVWVDGALNNASLPSRGWGMEMALPWSLLSHAAGRPCPPKPGDQWRINFSRVQYKVGWDAETGRYFKDPADQPEQNWVWSPQWQVAMHLPEFWGYVQFSQVGAEAAASGAARGPSAPADATFRPDPSWPLRTFLVEAYNRQRGLWEREQRYSDCFMELGVQVPPPGVAERAVAQTTEVGFLVSAQMPVPDTGVRAEAQGAEEPSLLAGGEAGVGGGVGRADGKRQVRRFYINEEGRIFSRLLWVDPAPPGPSPAPRGRGHSWIAALLVSGAVVAAGLAAAAITWRGKGPGFDMRQFAAFAPLRSVRRALSALRGGTAAGGAAGYRRVRLDDDGGHVLGLQQQTELEEQPLLSGGGGPGGGQEAQQQYTGIRWGQPAGSPPASPPHGAATPGAAPGH